MDDYVEKRTKKFSELRTWLQESVDAGQVPESEQDRETRIAVVAHELKEQLLDTIKRYVLQHEGTAYESVKRALAAADADYRSEFAPELDFEADK